MEHLSEVATFRLMDELDLILEGETEGVSSIFLQA